MEHRWVASVQSRRPQYSCLVDAFNVFGLQVNPSRSGAFWALFDGNELLAPYSLVLVPVTIKSILRRGRFVLYRSFHFFALSHSDMVLMVDGSIQSSLSY